MKIVSLYLHHEFNPIIEDEEKLRLLLKRIISLEGFTIVEAKKMAARAFSGLHII